MEGGDKRGHQIPRDDGPVKGHGEKAIATVATKYLVNNDAVRPYPRDPAEPGQALKEITREPIPKERPSEYYQEPSVPADGPAIGP